MAKYGRAKKYDEKDGYWFSTENGTHIHAESGQTPREAVDERFKRAKANNAQVDRENAEREKLYAQDEERWGKKEPQSYNGAKARRNPNFDEKEYGEFFDERGVLKEGKEDEYFEKIENQSKGSSTEEKLRDLEQKVYDAVDEGDNDALEQYVKQGAELVKQYKQETGKDFKGDAGLDGFYSSIDTELKNNKKVLSKEWLDDFYEEANGDEDVMTDLIRRSPEYMNMDSDPNDTFSMGDLDGIIDAYMKEKTGKNMIERYREKFNKNNEKSTPTKKALDEMKQNFDKGDALKDYLKEDESESETNDDAQRYLDKTWENPLKNREGWARQENGRYDFGDDENYGSINNDGEVEETVTAKRVRNGDHDRPQVKYFENVEDAIEWVEEEPSTESKNTELKSDSERARKIKEARDRLKGGRQFNLSDDDIEYILKALNKW